MTFIYAISPLDKNFPKSWDHHEMDRLPLLYAKLTCDCHEGLSPSRQPAWHNILGQTGRRTGSAQAALTSTRHLQAPSSYPPTSDGSGLSVFLAERVALGRGRGTPPCSALLVAGAGAALLPTGAACSPHDRAPQSIIVVRPWCLLKLSRGPVCLRPCLPASLPAVSALTSPHSPVLPRRSPAPAARNPRFSLLIFTALNLGLL